MNQFHGKKGEPPRRLFRDRPKGGTEQPAKNSDRPSKPSTARSGKEDLGRLFEKPRPSVAPQPPRAASHKARPDENAEIMPLFEEKVFCNEIQFVIALVKLIREDGWRSAGKINDELSVSGRHETWARDFYRIIAEEGVPELVKGTIEYFAEVERCDPTVTHMPMRLRSADISSCTEPVSALLAECLEQGWLGDFVKPSDVVYGMTTRLARALFRMVQHEIAPHLSDGTVHALAPAHRHDPKRGIVNPETAATSELGKLINKDPAQAAAALIKGCTVCFRILSHAVSAADRAVTSGGDRVQVGLVPRLIHEMTTAAMTANLRYLRSLGVDVAPIEKQIKVYGDKQFDKTKFPPEKNFYPYLDANQPEPLSALRESLAVIYQRLALVAVARTGMMRGVSYMANFDLISNLAGTLKTHFPELVDPLAKRSAVPLGSVSIVYEGTSKGLAIVNETNSLGRRKLDVVPPLAEDALKQSKTPGETKDIFQGILFSHAGEPIGNEFVEALRTVPAPDGMVIERDPLEALFSPDPESAAVCGKAYRRLVQLGHDLLAETPALRACISEFGEVDLVLLNDVRGVLISSTCDEVVESLIGHSHTKLPGEEFAAKLPHTSIEFELKGLTFWQFKEGDEAASREGDDKPGQKSEVSIKVGRELEQDWLSFFEKYCNSTSPKLHDLQTFLRRGDLPGIKWDEKVGKGSHTKIFYTDPVTQYTRSIPWAVSHHNGHTDKSSPVTVALLSKNLASIGAKVPWELQR